MASSESPYQTPAGKPPPAATHTPAPASPSHGKRPRPCHDCDLGAIDDLHCEAEGIKTRADKTAEYATKLEERRAQFDDARKDYPAARTAATPTIKSLREELDRILDQLRCLLEHDEVECVDLAYWKVVEQLEACGGVGGCCFDDDCDFDESCDGPNEDLRARLAGIEERLAKAEGCFDELVKEPVSLAERVADLKAAVESIVAELGGDPKKADLRATYAKALVAWAHLAEIWGGFEYANEYYDCLCRALTCSLSGRKVLALLYAELDVRECREGAREKRCDWLRGHLVEEIIAVALKTCGPEQPCEDEAPSEDDESE